MPVLRSAKSKRLLPPLGSKPRPESMQWLATKNNFCRTIKIESVSSISNTEIADIKKCLQTSPSEAKFYGDLCEIELKKLVEERDIVNRNIQEQLEYNKQKDSEAARLVKKLWDANKRVSVFKHTKGRRNEALRWLSPNDVKKVFEGAKKMSKQLKLRRNLLIARKQRLESKINLAIDTIKFCRKFTYIRR
ncbi:hypothetical protein JTB14_017173 [Gonioctena quinquepunctata]|nr:hypothetical protein JTB14_017173 [Gonioctena quinquepunctata]